MAKKKITKKTKVHDAEIGPLMAKVYEICKKNNIAFIASFSLDVDGTVCTSLLLDEKCNPPESYLEARNVIIGKSFLGIFDEIL